MKYDPEHGADHLSEHDLERDVDPPTEPYYSWVHEHVYVTATLCTVCGEAKGLEVEA
jgi:hypothetical protein